VGNAAKSKPVAAKSSVEVAKPVVKKKSEVEMKAEVAEAAIKKKPEVEMKADILPIAIPSGPIRVLYNHYNEEFNIHEGKLNSFVIDEQFSLSFAFPNCKLHLRLEGTSVDMAEKVIPNPNLSQDAEDSRVIVEYSGLEVGKKYVVSVEEDSAEAAKSRVRQKEYETRIAEETKNKDKDEDLVRGNKERIESCSCIEGIYHVSCSIAIQLSMSYYIFSSLILNHVLFIDCTQSSELIVHQTTFTCNPTYQLHLLCNVHISMLTIFDWFFVVVSCQAILVPKVTTVKIGKIDMMSLKNMDGKDFHELYCQINNYQYNIGKQFTPKYVLAI
jgi:hypothetical protein